MQHVTFVTRKGILVILDWR